MKNLLGYTLVSDMDGTLIHNSGKVCQRNIDAINEFKRLGGKFLIATGRTKESVKPYEKVVGASLPCIVSNGAGVYDFHNSEYIMNVFLDDSIKDIVNDVKEVFKDVGIEIMAMDNLYVVRENQYTINHRNNENLSCTLSNLEDIKDKFMKVSFSQEDEYLKNIDIYMKEKYPQYNTVRSGKHYYEIVPMNVDKSTAIKFMVEKFGLDKDKLFTIGDFYNDVGMLKYAKVSATTSGTIDEIKEIASIVVGTSENGAVADFIEYIIENFGG